MGSYCHETVTMLQIAETEEYGEKKHYNCPLLKKEEVQSLFYFTGEFQDAVQTEGCLEEPFLTFYLSGNRAGGKKALNTCEKILW